jgi:hypothetical protein
MFAMASKGRLLAAAALGALSLALAVGSARADVVYLEGGAKITGEVIEETPQHVIVKKPSGLTLTIRREEIAKIERDRNPAQEFEARMKALSSGDANGFYELGKWAASKALKDQAQKAWNRAIQIDPEHAGAREALGHRKYNGKWYDAEGYKKAVEGLVEWHGQWVTPGDRDLLEQGFVKNEKGEWVRKEDLERQEGEKKEAEERERQRLAGGPKPEKEKEKENPGTVARTEPRAAPATATPKGKAVEIEPEDTAWYDDHATNMSWDEAKLKPYESRFYLIYTNIKPEYAKRYGLMMDVYSLKYRRVFNAEKNIRGAIPKGKIYIYPDQQSFMAGEKVSEGVGGFYQPGQNRVVCYHGRFGPTGTTRTVLVHEATHQFEDFVLPGKMWFAPIWIVEGFAVFFESAKWDGKEVNIGHVPHDRLMNLKQGIAANNYIHLPELIRTEHAAFTGYHYAHAWSLIYYMLYGGKTKKIREHNQQVFSDLFFLAKTKGTPVTPEDVEALWGGKEKFAAWEEEWKQWLVDLPYDFDPKDPDASRAKGDKGDPEKPQQPPEPQPPDDGGDQGKTEPRNMYQAWDEALDAARRLATAPIGGE